jgi:dolichol-phosphate mannosyltransferase
MLRSLSDVGSALLRIVIPAHDEQERIGPTIEEYCTEFGDLATIVVVANGCSDRTAEIVASMQERFANLALVDVPNAIGKGGAVRVGFATGSEPFAGFTDADGSTGAREFKRLFELLRASGNDALVGSRWMADSRITTAQSRLRRIASRTFNGVVRGLFGLRIKDTQCGAKLFRREALGKILRALEVADFAFDIELLVRLERSGCSIVEAPTVWSDRADGTKIRLLRSSWTMLKSVLRLRLRETALWRVPLVDRFAKHGVIPVKQGRRVLVLGAAGAVRNPQLERFFSGLRAAGVEIAFAEEESGERLSPLRAMLWYALRSRREYDAVMEIAGRRSWIVPRFTAKPAFVVACDDRWSSRRRVHERCALIDLRAQDAAMAVEVVMATVYVEPAYPAIFMETPQGFALHYADRKTGARTEHALY